MSTHSSYTSDPVNLGYPAGNPITVGSKGYYTMTVCVGTALPATPCAGGGTAGTAFALTATAAGTQANDTACTTLSVDSTGNQTQTGASTTCWTN